MGSSSSSSPSTSSAELARALAYAKAPDARVSERRRQPSSLPSFGSEPSLCFRSRRSSCDGDLPILGTTTSCACGGRAGRPCLGRSASARAALRSFRSSPRVPSSRRCRRTTSLKPRVCPARSPRPEAAGIPLHDRTGPGDLRRDHGRDPAGCARPDDRRDRAAGDRRRPRRPDELLVGDHLVHPRDDRHRAAVREARRHLRPTAPLARRDLDLPVRLGALRPCAVDEPARRLPRRPGHGRGRAVRARARDDRRDRPAARPRPLPGAVRVDLRPGVDRRPAAGRDLRRPGQLALGVLRQRAGRPGRYDGDRDRRFRSGPLAATTTSTFRARRCSPPARDRCSSAWSGVATTAGARRWSSARSSWQSGC